MQHSEVIATLAELEQRFEVHTWASGSVPLWPQIRTGLGAQLMHGQPVVGASRPPLPPPLPMLLDGGRTGVAALRDFEHTRWKLRAADVLTLSYPTSRLQVSGRLFDRFFDPIADVVEKWGGRVLQLEHHRAGTQYRLPRYRSSMLIQPLVARELLATALARSVPREAPPGYSDLRQAVEGAHQGVKLPEPRALLRQAHQITRLADFFERVLDRVRPRLVLVSCYYNPVGWALCLAARRRGILSVDLQHGVVVRNPAYEGWTRFPAGGYRTLPDLFWCWSEADTVPVRTWPVAVRPHHQAFAGGQPLAAYFEDSVELSRIRARVRDMRGPALNVLVSLSTTGVTVEIMQAMLAAPTDWRFWLRLHPTKLSLREETRERCEASLPGHCLVDEGTDLPLPALLRELDVHLTLHSTVLQEAAACGMPSVLLDANVTDIYSQELASGWAVFAKGATEVVAALRSQYIRRESLPRSTSYPPRSEFVATIEALLDDPNAFQAGLKDRAP